MVAEVTAVFDVGVGENRDPRIILLNRIVNALSKKESVALITEVLVEGWGCDKKSIPLLEALERLLGEDKIAFREHLRSIFTRCVISSNFRQGYYDAPELYPVILAKVLKGWDWRWDGDECEVSSDAEVCFQYFCKAHTRAQHLITPRLQAPVSDILRKHIDNAGWSGKWRFQDLDSWIIRKGTPEAVATILLHAQMRMGGVSRAVKWIKST